VSLEQFKTQVLLLHSQQSTLDTLSAGFTDKYAVHCATSGTEALNTLGQTPIHIIVTAQDLPGMSGLEALREAKKRSPDTIGILLAGNDSKDGLEALVGDKEVFQIVRGKIEPDALRKLVENVHRQARLIALAESANDQSANVDEPLSEHIVMETASNGSMIISDGTGQMPVLKPEKIQIAPGVGGRDVDVLVLTKDEEFLATIKNSARGLHNVHHALTTTQADEFSRKNKIGVLVTDAAMADDGVESLTKRLRKESPRLVAIVAGRRDDGEMLMDLINRGHVYRFLLKPVSPGRARLAIEASVKHHMEAPDDAFKPKFGFSLLPRKNPQAALKAKAEAEAKRKAAEARKAEQKRQAEAEAQRQAEEKARAEAEARRKAEAEARRKAEEKARAEAEARRIAEEKAKAEAEARRIAEEKAKAEAEARRIAKEKAKAEAEARRIAKEKAKAEAEARRIAEEKAKARRIAEEKAKAEAEARRIAEEKAKAEAEVRRIAEEEAKAEAKARRIAKEKARAEAEARRIAEAEAKAKAKEVARLAAERKAREKAEAKTRAKAEAAAKKQAKAEARAEAKARKAATQKIEPVISTDAFDISPGDGLDGAFTETNSFTDTMTDIAAVVSERVSGAAGSVADSAQDLLDALGVEDSPLHKPKAIAIGGGAVVVLALFAWFIMGGDDVPDDVVTEVTNVAAPAPAEPRFAAPAAESAATAGPATAAQASAFSTRLEQARAARDAGRLLSPAGVNALELYAALVAAARDDAAIQVEFDDVVSEALSVVESEILARNVDAADAALGVAALADPDNARIGFLRAQVNELLLRDRSDQARAAIRDARFEDAGRLISQARTFAGADPVEVDLLTDELNVARSQQQVGETIAIANARLNAGDLVAPANDNARYYFELALSSDPQNQAARQGLITLAGKLVLQAQVAINDGRLDKAARILDEAGTLDPSSSELQSAVASLDSARDAIAEAARQAEAERQAALQRKQQAARQAELQRQAEAEARERARIANEQRAAAAAAQARDNAEKLANRVATASPLGVGAAAPRRTEPVPAAAQPRPGRPEPSTTSTPQPSRAEAEPIARDTTTVVLSTTNAHQAEPQPRLQSQAANTVNVKDGTGSAGTVGASQQPEMVAISRLTRTNYVGPKYPRAAQRRNITGSVEITFTVTTDGRVRGISVLRSDPGDTFEKAAIDAVEQWRFAPVIENGSAVEKRTAVRLAFNLN